MTRAFITSFLFLLITPFLFVYHTFMATTGTWTVGGYTIPDFGITEKLGAGTPNPLVLAQDQGTTSGLVGSGGQAISTPDTSANPTNTVNLSGLQSQQYYGPQPNPVSVGTPTQSQPSGPSQPSGAPPYASNTENQTVTYNGQTFKSDGKGGWVLQNAPSGPSEADLNAVYEPTMNYLNQAEQTVREQYPSVLDAAQRQYEAAISELTGAKEKNLGTVKESAVQAGQRKEDALSAARRLYDELRRGYGQRFGGASSAGQAASEIASVEQQRQMGQTNRDYGTTMRQIDQTKLQLDQDYQTGQAKILEQKTLAIQQAQQNFTNQLLQIQAQRAQTESQKAAAKLQALNDLRNQALAAQQQALTYQQNLDMFYKQQQADLQNYAAKLAMAGQGSASAIAKYLPPTNPTSNLQATNTGASTNQIYTGSIKKPEDLSTIAGQIGFNTPQGGYGSYDPYKLGL